MTTTTIDNIHTAWTAVASPENWAFLGEGKAHVVCRYVGADDDAAAVAFAAVCGFPPRHAVLRLPKKTTGDGTETNADHDTALRHWFSPRYCPRRPPPLPLPPSFVAALAAQVHADRPPGRRHVAMDSHAAYGEVDRNHATLWRTFLPLPFQPHKALSVVSVEIKVKCNDVSLGPFVRACNGIKRTVGRYDLLQRARAVQAAQPGQHAEAVWAWGTHDGSLSRYDPTDLLSGAPARVATAVDALLATPQNNLRVLVGEAHVYGWDRSGAADRAALGRACVDGGWGGGEGEGEGGLASAVAAALVAEKDVLLRLRSMQRLDVLDVEGAALALDLLTTHVGRDEVEAAVAGAPLWGSEAEADAVRAFADAAHAAAVAGGGATDGCCDDIDQLRDTGPGRGVQPAVREALLLPLRGPAALGDGGGGAVISAALRLWLLSLLARDCSVVVAMQPLSGRGEEGEGRGDGAGWEVLSTQTETAAGVLRLSHGDGGQGTGVGTALWAYSVGLVDMGPKPLGKARAKDGEEDALCAAAARYK